MTKTEFFDILFDGKTLYFLKDAPIEKLHYLQIIFFKPIFAQISVGLFVFLGVFPIGFIDALWLRLVLLGLVGYFDYRNRRLILPAIRGDDCLYEVFRDGGLL